MANKGPLYGLSKDCKLKAEKKFDASRAQDVLEWMEAVLDRKLHDDVRSLKTEYDFSTILKDGVAICEYVGQVNFVKFAQKQLFKHSEDFPDSYVLNIVRLINRINPGAIKRINKQNSAFKQMENIEMFTKACIDYGMNPLDTFQMTDLYETKALYTVFNCLHALGSLALKNGYKGPLYGVKISDKKERHFSQEQIAEGRRIIPMQAGTNALPSQSGMTPYGLSRQIIPSDSDVTEVPLPSQSVISLQYGTNRNASQSGMTPYGLGRQIVSKSSISDDANGSDAVSNSNSDTPMERDLSAEDNAFLEDDVL